MNRLPCETLVQILSFLPADDLQRCIALNRRTSCLIKKFWNQMQRRIIKHLYLSSYSTSKAIISCTIKPLSKSCSFLSLHIIPDYAAIMAENQEPFQKLIEEFVGKPVRSKSVHNAEELVIFIFRLLEKNLAQDVVEWHENIENCFRIKNREKLAEMAGLQLEMDKLSKFMHTSNGIIEIVDIDQGLYIIEHGFVECYRKYPIPPTMYYEISNGVEFFHFFMKKVLRQRTIQKIVVSEPFPTELHHFNLLVHPDAKVHELELFGKPDFKKYCNAPLTMYKSIEMNDYGVPKMQDMSLLLPKLYGVNIMANDFFVDSENFVDVVNSFVQHSKPESFSWIFRVRGEIDAEFYKNCIEEDHDWKEYFRIFNIFRPTDGQNIKLTIHPLFDSDGFHVSLEFP